jgi:hypothetical protein
LTLHMDEVVGSIVVSDPLTEAQELLRLIDEGKFGELSAAVIAATLRARVDATREVLELDQPEQLKKAG